MQSVRLRGADGRSSRQRTRTTEQTCRTHGKAFSERLRNNPHPELAPDDACAAHRPCRPRASLHTQARPGEFAMTSQPTTVTPSAPPRGPGDAIDFAAVKQRQQSTWASGDYAIIGTTLQIVGESLAEAADIRADERVL